MEASQSDIESLFKLQNIDRDILQQTKELQELPQREIIMAARAKRAEVQAKANQVAALKKDVRRKMTRVEDEDAALAKKETGVQAAIDAAQGNYRNVEARTKELAGIVRRRGTLAEDLAKIQAELQKVEDIEAQVTLALEEIAAKEQQAIESFQAQGGALKMSIARLEAERDKLASAIDPSLVQVYEQTSARVGGVAIGYLEGDRCGVCRTRIESGRLIDLRNQAPLGSCPSCKRLLIIA